MCLLLYVIVLPILDEGTLISTQKAFAHAVSNLTAEFSKHLGDCMPLGAKV